MKALLTAQDALLRCEAGFDRALRRHRAAAVAVIDSVSLQLELPCGADEIAKLASALVMAIGIERTCLDNSARLARHRLERELRELDTAQANEEGEADETIH